MYIKGLVLTIGLGGLFTLLQGLEYYNSPFTISDGVYGTTFYGVPASVVW
jgi:heme/copper-type cytochrome/quinol oxidase subunit 3